jgi:hypothetical protein
VSLGVSRVVPAESAHLSDTQLGLYLDGGLSKRKRALARDHLDRCRECWQKWNVFRWQRAEGTRALLELRAFLGDHMREGIDSSWLLAGEWQGVDHHSSADVTWFYATTPWYIYNSTIWAASGQRPKYVERAAPVVGSLSPRTVCDFGCGVGTDGLLFAEQGKQVAFVDINEPALDFLRWRLQERGLPGCVGTPAEAERWLPVDLLWAMDVIEHLLDPMETLAPFLEACSAFIFDSDHVGKSAGRQPFHFQHDMKQFSAGLETFGLTQVWPPLNKISNSLYGF